MRNDRFHYTLYYVRYMHIYGLSVTVDPVNADNPTIGAVFDKDPHIIACFFLGRVSGASLGDRMLG